METIANLDFIYLDRSLLKKHNIEIGTLVEVFRGRSGMMVKKGPRSLVKHFRVGGQEIYLKLYSAYSFTHWLRGFWGTARANGAFENACRLAELGIGTAPVLAVVERDQTKFMMNSGLFTLSLAPAQMVTSFFLNQLSNSDTEEERQVVLHELARFLFSMHEAGVYPKDFKAANLLVQKENLAYAFYLLDYDSFLFLGSVSLRRRLKNLYQIGVTLGQVLTPEECLYLLQCYRENIPSLRMDTQMLGRDIARGIETRLVRKKQRSQNIQRNG